MKRLSFSLDCGFAIQRAVWYICGFCIVSNSAFSQSNAIKIKNIVCPNLCQGESVYLIVFEATSGKISTSHGAIRNDTIVGILPKNDFKITLTITSDDSIVSTQTVPLPICDPMLPPPPLVSSQSLCDSTSITPFKAFTTDGATVDWYDSPSSSLALKSETLQFFPPHEGTYFARSRFMATGCTSIAFTRVSLEIKKAVCPIMSIRKRRK